MGEGGRGRIEGNHGGAGAAHGGIINIIIVVVINHCGCFGGRRPRQRLRRLLVGAGELKFNRDTILGGGGSNVNHSTINKRTAM